VPYLLKSSLYIMTVYNKCTRGTDVWEFVSVNSAREERVLGHQRRDVLLHTKIFSQLLQVLGQRQQDEQRLGSLKVL
jgi:hypothetical protein